MAQVAGFDPAGFESAIANLRKSGLTSRGDIESTFQKALDEISTSNQEAMRLIGELEAGDSTNAAKMVSLVRAPIDAAVSDAVRTMTDARQRGGYSGSPRVRSMIEATVRSLVPLAGEKVSEALATKERLTTKRAGMLESAGQQRSGLFAKKGESLSGIEQGVASQIASIEKSREQAKLDEARRLDDLKVGLLAAAKPSSIQDFYKNLGMEYNPHVGQTYNSRTGEWEATEGGGGSGGAGSNVDYSGMLKSYNQAQNLYASYDDPWRPGGRNMAGMGFTQDIMSQLNRLAKGR